ncbi:hypothetical protein D3C79_968310 [compost metagenome]
MVNVKIFLKDGTTRKATLRPKWWGFLQLHVAQRHDLEVWDVNGELIRVADIQTVKEVD